MIKACIFDLDGTLADTVESIAYGINHTLKYFGYLPRPVDEYNYYAGDGIDLALKRALAAAGDVNGVHLKEGIPMTRIYFGSNPLYHVKPFPGIIEMLDELKERGVMLAVLSNKPHDAALSVVSSLFGDRIFDLVQGQSPEIPKKPNPKGALTIMQQFGISKEEVIYLGDTDTDMKTGRAAGMYTVGVTWGFRTPEELEKNHACALVRHPQQILELLECLNQDSESKLLYTHSAGLGQG